MKKRITNDYTNKFTGERLSVYPTPFTALSNKSMRPSDEAKLIKARENFGKRNLCPLCGQPRTWINDTNVVMCKNEQCKGYPVKDKEGNIVGYRDSYGCIDTHGEEIAMTIFD